MCGSIVDIKSPTAEIRRGKHEEEEEDRNHRAKIQWSVLLHRTTIIILIHSALSHKMIFAVLYVSS